MGPASAIMSSTGTKPGAEGQIRSGAEPAPAINDEACMQRRLLSAAAVLLAFCAGIARAEPPLAELLANAAPTADRAVLTLAARAAECVGRQDPAEAVDRLAVIDYSRPSSEPRLWVFDLDRGRLLFEELVAHGRGTGDRLAEHFSNIEGSHMSSLGLFRATESYDGANGYSLRLQGLEPGFNDHAFDRAIVIHGAPYVSQDLVRKQGTIGRSWGCPAVRSAVARRMIDTLKHGALVFAYYPDGEWLEESSYLRCGATPAVAAVARAR
jgi:hypothetical protein